VQDQGVAIGILEESHVADARIPFADEFDALRLELRPRGRHVGDSQRDTVRAALRELDPLVLGLPDCERDVACLELRRLARVLRQPEHVAIERDRPLDVTRRDVDEIDAFDLHQGSEPSG
jgi:hypothetical protein